MKKANIAIICLSVLVVALVATLILTYQSNSMVKTKEITIEVALKEMPYINISPEETAFIQSLRQDSDVIAAIASERIVDLSIEKGAKLSAKMLPDDIRISEFSVINKTIYFGYFINDYRVILEIFADNRIHKTIGVYSKDDKVKTVYENYDNKVFQKTHFKTY